MPLLRDAFKIANAITRLAGYEPTASDLARQERVIAGEISFEEAVREAAGKKTEPHEPSH